MPLLLDDKSGIFISFQKTNGLCFITLIYQFCGSSHRVRSRQHLIHTSNDGRCINTKIITQCGPSVAPTKSICS